MPTANRDRKNNPLYLFHFFEHAHTREGDAGFVEVWALNFGNAVAKALKICSSVPSPGHTPLACQPLPPGKIHTFANVVKVLPPLRSRRTYPERSGPERSGPQAEQAVRRTSYGKVDAAWVYTAKQYSAKCFTPFYYRYSGPKNALPVADKLARHKG